MSLSPSRQNRAESRQNRRGGGTVPSGHNLGELQNTSRGGGAKGGGEGLATRGDPTGERDQTVARAGLSPPILSVVSWRFVIKSSCLRCSMWPIRALSCCTQYGPRYFGPNSNSCCEQIYMSYTSCSNIVHVSNVPLCDPILHTVSVPAMLTLSSDPIFAIFE